MKVKFLSTPGGASFSEIGPLFQEPAERAFLDTVEQQRAEIRAAFGSTKAAGDRQPRRSKDEA